MNRSSWQAFADYLNMREFPALSSAVMTALAKLDEEAAGEKRTTVSFPAASKVLAETDITELESRRSGLRAR